jgi:hypothetical protein
MNFNNLPSKETVARLREQYPEGTLVELVSMDDPYTKLKPGDRGKVSGVDDTGTIFVRWDSGSGLGIVYGIDSVKKIEQEIHYDTGVDMWRDAARSHGIDEATVICNRYLKMQLKQEIPESETTFCRELFGAMFEAISKQSSSARLVYPYDFQKANDRAEASHYHDSRKLNNQCAAAIDAAIHDSCYKPSFYNLRLAAMCVVSEFGFERVNAVLAHSIQGSGYDGRISAANKDWASGYVLPEKAFNSATLNAHAILIYDFTKYVREYYSELGAERFALPGRAESGEMVNGYEITRSITFDDMRGFAIAHDPDAVSPYVCWQFTVENGVRDFYWGDYSNDEKGAADNFVARVIKHMYGENVKELPDYIATANKSKEQSEELQPPVTAESTQSGYTSVLKTIEQSKTAPRPPHKAKNANNKHKGDEQL